MDLDIYIEEVEKILTNLDYEHPSDDWIREDFENGFSPEESAKLWANEVKGRQFKTKLNF